MARSRSGSRGRVALLVAVPLAVVVLAGVSLLGGLTGRVHDTAARRDTAATAAAVAPLLDALVAERNLVVVATGTPAAPDRLLAARARSAAAAGLARNTLGGHTPAVVTAAIDALDGLDVVRPPRSAAPGQLIADYGGRIAALVEAANAGTAPDGPPTVDPLLRAGERRAAVEAGLLLAVTDPARAREAADLTVVADAAAAVQWQRYADPATGDVVAQAAAAPTEGRIAALAAELRSDPDGFASTTPGPVLLAEVSAAAEGRATTGRAVLAVLARDAGAAATSAAAAAVGTGAALLVAAAVVTAVGLRIGASTSRPRRRPAAAADAVADPARAELARGPDRATSTVAAADGRGDDEAGDLATPSNRVQAVTALLLEQQVALRRHSAAVLGHLGRRTRSLVARQLDLVTMLESGEQDPERLERLYLLDHLTTRLRRNADALLVLADVREDDAGAPPLALTDVLRAALASIEGYRRVVLDEVVDVEVPPFARGDIALLLAELLENAATSSPPEAHVLVRAVGEPAGCRVEIVDRGRGMPAAELTARNRELREPERPEQAPAPALGLALIGRIARRHGLGVALRPTPGGGTTAVVGLPRRLLVPTAGTPATGTPATGEHAAAERAQDTAAERAQDAARPPGPRHAGPAPRAVPVRAGHDGPTARHQLAPPPAPDPAPAAAEPDRPVELPAPRHSTGRNGFPVLPAPDAVPPAPSPLLSPPGPVPSPAGSGMFGSGPSGARRSGAEPSATEPSAAKPSATEPSAAEPSATEPSAAEPSGAGASRSGPSGPGPSRSDPTRPDLSRPDLSRPDLSGSRFSWSEPPRSEPVGGGPSGAEPSRSEPSGAGPSPSVQTRSGPSPSGAPQAAPSPVGATPTGPAPTAPPEPGAAPLPPAGAAGLRRRVRGAVVPPVPAASLLAAVTDADAERAFVEEMQAGVARAVARARAATERTNQEER